MDPLYFFTIIFVTFVIVAFLTWFFIHKSREKERLLLIEKGTDYSQLPDRKVFNFNFPWLKLGTVVTSITIGTGIGVIIMENGGHEGVVPLLMFLFGGIGMITAHYVDKPATNHEK
ncbi:MAG: DUF3149 domain-containing protein [Balneolaceae bacterium]